jgi:hypothetical protein
MTSSDDARSCLLGWKKSEQSLWLMSVGATGPLGASTRVVISSFEFGGKELRLRFSEGGHEKTFMVSSAVVIEDTPQRDKNSFSTVVALVTAEWGSIVLLEV